MSLVERVDAAAARVSGWLGESADGSARPGWGVIAGSGLSGLADRLEGACRLDYAEIPGWPRSTVEGHAGALVAGRVGDRRVLVCAGRAHLYEGYEPAEASFNVRVLSALGVETLIVTNAAGALNGDYAPGDLMLLTDHINLPGMAGLNPLRGPNDDRRGPRFPFLAGAYDPDLRARAQAAAEAAGFRVHQGVYAMVAGPSFETPAEARFLRAAGADAVGMSTAPEVVVARHAGMRVLGISLITNHVLLEQPEATVEESGAALHAEVTEVGGRASERLARVVAELLG